MLLDATEAADKYCYSRRTIIDYFKSGRVKAEIRDGKWTTTDEAMEAYLKDNAEMIKKFGNHS
jgi:hypothetical protein